MFQKFFGRIIGFGISLNMALGYLSLYNDKPQISGIWLKLKWCFHLFEVVGSQAVMYSPISALTNPKKEISEWESSLVSFSVLTWVHDVNHRWRRNSIYKLNVAVEYFFTGFSCKNYLVDEIFISSWSLNSTA